MGGQKLINLIDHFFQTGIAAVSAEQIGQKPEFPGRLRIALLQQLFHGVRF